jgi:hypothetical protein
MVLLDHHARAWEHRRLRDRVDLNDLILIRTAAEPTRAQLTTRSSGSTTTRDELQHDPERGNNVIQSVSSISQSGGILTLPPQAGSQVVSATVIEIPATRQRRG